jgi:hypothetical protein
MRAFILATLLAGTAIAAPPPVGSEDWAVMGPHSGWIEGLRRNGVSCCDSSDGRPVDARVHGGRWQVKFRSGQLPTAPLHWTDVEDAAVLRVANPVGQAIAFWAGGRVLCFVPPAGG